MADAVWDEDGVWTEEAPYPEAGSMTIIRNLAPVPSRTRPAVFSEESDALLSNLPGWTEEVNTVAIEMSEARDVALTGAGVATTKAEEAAASAVEALVYATQAAGTANATKWVSGTTYAEGDNVWSPITYQTYRRRIAGAGTTDPASDATNWECLTSNKTIVRAGRTSNTMLDRTNSGDFIDITAGTFTQTFDACANLRAGWFCFLRNAGTGTITLDPDGSETIDGMTSFVMYPGESRLIQCDASSLRSIVLSPFYLTFTMSGTFVKPPGYTAFGNKGWGGGGSGRKGSSGASPGGGSGAGCTEIILPSSVYAASESVIIGAGGAAVTSADTSGAPGGDTTLGSLLWAGGGLGGLTSSSIVDGGWGFADVTSQNQAYCGDQARGFYGGAQARTATSGTIHGGAAGGCLAAGVPTYSSATVYGGAGGVAQAAASGVDGAAPGGGGGATNTGTQSGAGGRGELRIWGIA